MTTQTKQKKQLSWKFIIIFTLALLFIQIAGMFLSMIYNPVLAMMSNYMFTFQLVVVIIRKMEDLYD